MEDKHLTSDCSCFQGSGPQFVCKSVNLTDQPGYELSDRLSPVPRPAVMSHPPMSLFLKLAFIILPLSFHPSHLTSPHLVPVLPPSYNYRPLCNPHSHSHTRLKSSPPPHWNEVCVNEEEVARMVGKDKREMCTGKGRKGAKRKQSRMRQRTEGAEEGNKALLSADSSSAHLHRAHTHSHTMEY